MAAAAQQLRAAPGPASRLPRIHRRSCHRQRGLAALPLTCAGIAGSRVVTCWMCLAVCSFPCLSPFSFDRPPVCGPCCIHRLCHVAARERELFAPPRIFIAPTRIFTRVLTRVFSCIHCTDEHPHTWPHQLGRSSAAVAAARLRPPPT